MIDYTNKSIFSELGLSVKEANILQFKAELLIKIKEIAKDKNLTRRDLEKILDAPQPRISDLMTGKIDKFSIEVLISYLILLGASVFPQVNVA